MWNLNLDQHANIEVFFIKKKIICPLQADPRAIFDPFYPLVI